MRPLPALALLQWGALLVLVCGGSAALAEVRCSCTHRRYHSYESLYHSDGDNLAQELLQQMKQYRLRVSKLTADKSLAGNSAISAWKERLRHEAQALAAAGYPTDELPSENETENDVYEATAEPPKKKPSNSFESECLASHNKWRRLHNAGELELDEEIVVFAQKRAGFIARSDGREFKHPPNLPYGENLAWHSIESASCADLIQMWYNEVRSYDFSRGTFSHATGHFSQLVWRNTRRVGCARATSDGSRGGVFLVCNYDPPGNMIGDAAANVLRGSSSGILRRTEEIINATTNDLYATNFIASSLPSKDITTSSGNGTIIGLKIGGSNGTIISRTIGGANTTLTTTHCKAVPLLALFRVPESPNSGNTTSVANKINHDGTLRTSSQTWTRPSSIQAKEQHAVRVKRSGDCSSRFGCRGGQCWKGCGDDNSSYGLENDVMCYTRKLGSSSVARCAKASDCSGCWECASYCIKGSLLNR